MSATKTTVWLCCVGLVLLSADVYWPRTISVAALHEQLQGHHCHFKYQDQCQQRGLEPLQRLLIQRHDCDLWAVQCLNAFKSDEAVDVLLQVIKEKTDIETCDGVYPIRSYAVDQLANNGQNRAVGPLKSLLESRPNAKLSVGASGCTPNPEDPAHIAAAIRKLQN